MIAPTMISGGVKALILMLKEDFIIWGTACGDNCSKWIIEIAKQKDFTICLEHVMNFPEEFEMERQNSLLHMLEPDEVFKKYGYLEQREVADFRHGYVTVESEEK